MFPALLCRVVRFVYEVRPFLFLLLRLSPPLLSSRSLHGNLGLVKAFGRKSASRFCNVLTGLLSFWRSKWITGFFFELLWMSGITGSLRGGAEKISTCIRSFFLDPAFANTTEMQSSHVMCHLVAVYLELSFFFSGFRACQTFQELQIKDICA